MKDTIYHSPGCDLTDEQRRFVLDHLRARAEWSYDKVELLRAAGQIPNSLIHNSL